MSDSGVKYDCVTYTGTHPSKRSKVTVLIDGILVASACLPLVAKGCYCPPPPLRGHKDKGFGFGLEARSLVWGAEGGAGHGSLTPSCTGRPCFRPGGPARHLRALSMGSPHSLELRWHLSGGRFLALCYLCPLLIVLGTMTSPWWRIHTHLVTQTAVGT